MATAIEVWNASVRRAGREWLAINVRIKKSIHCILMISFIKYIVCLTLVFILLQLYALAVNMVSVSCQGCARKCFKIHTNAALINLQLRTYSSVHKKNLDLVLPQLGIKCTVDTKHLESNALVFLIRN